MDMDREVARRDFLKTAQAAVGMLAYGQGTAANAADQPKAPAAAVIISGAAYTLVLDYPMQPKRYSEVKLQDAFWEPRIATNAKVTISFHGRLAQAAKRNGVRLVAVSREEPARNRAFLSSGGVSVDAALSLDASHIRLAVTPTLILVRRNGVVIKSWVGRLNPQGEEDVLRLATRE